MKRNILCNSCKEEVRTMFLSDNPYPGEHLELVEGKAKVDFICDLCGKGIEKSLECWACSIWEDCSPNTYYPWEDEFLNISK